MRLIGKSRKDANQPKIEEGLRERFIDFIDLSSVGGNCPDLLVGFRGKNYLFEIKVPGEESVKKGKKTHRGRGELSDGQVIFNKTWRGQTQIVYNLEEILRAVGYSQVTEGPPRSNVLHIAEAQIKSKE